MKAKPHAEKEPSDKEKLVLLEYLKCFNQTKAYQAIYPKAKPDSARFESSRMFAKHNILAYKNKLIKEMMDSRQEELKIRWEQEVTQIAFSRLADYIDENGEVNIEKLADENPGAVKEFKKDIQRGEYGTNESTSFKLHSKDKALELMAKYLSLLNERGTPEAPIILEYVVPKPPKD